MYQNEENQNSKGGLLNNNYVIVIFIIIAFFIYQELKAWKELKAQEKVINDPNYNLASRIKAALNISFISSWVLTADLDLLLSLSTEITSWTGLQKAYSDLYGTALTTLLAKAFEDEPKKLQVFYANANKAGGAGGTNPPKTLTVGKVATALKLTDVLDLTNSSVALKRFVAGADVGKFLGYHSATIKGKRYAIVEISYYYFATIKGLCPAENLITY
jgi:hypothetical protein